MFVSEALPEHLKNRYNNLISGLHELEKDYQEYKASNVTIYYAIWRYIEDMGLEMDYDKAQDMAEQARILSIRKAVPIKTKETPAGVLCCFHEDILDEVLEDMGKTL